MRRFVALILALWILSVGSGVAEYFHDLDHDREDARADTIAKAKGQPAPEHPIHDENNCPIHAALHAPLLSVGWTPILIALGLLVAFLTQIASPLISRTLAYSIDCRGPPALLAH